MRGAAHVGEQEVTLVPAADNSALANLEAEGLLLRQIVVEILRV